MPPGSAAEDTAWREILDYFDSAIQLGMTATPKETKYVSNIHYFGEPVYTYSLKQGIEDGFLAPYKVVRVDLDHDLLGWRPEEGQVDDAGELIEDRVYNQKDFDRDIVFPQRDKLVAERIIVVPARHRPDGKTIVFCQDIDHAERMRQALVNVPRTRRSSQADHRYVMRITGDNDEGKAQLDNFIDPERRYPVIATTSKLMTTGVDAQTCQVIVLDQRIQSLTEFKQIIGRAPACGPTTASTSSPSSTSGRPPSCSPTRLGRPADPVYEVPRATTTSPRGADPDDEPIDRRDRRDPRRSRPRLRRRRGRRATTSTSYVVSGVKFTVVAERVQYYDKDGKLITESLKDYTRRTVQEEFATLDDFLKRWKAADRKQAIVDELLERGVLLEALADSGRQATSTRSTSSAMSPSTSRR